MTNPAHLVIENNGIRYIPLAAVAEAHAAGSVTRLLDMAKNPIGAIIVSELAASEPLVVASPSSDEEGVQRPPSIYDFPAGFDLGAVVTLRIGATTHKGQVRLIARNHKPVSAIIWSGREHTVVKDFLANMEELNAVYDGVSTFTVY